MRPSCVLALGLASVIASAQTADEVISKNLAARGGLDRILAIKTLRMKGKQHAGEMTIDVGMEASTPNLVRQTFTIQGMTAISAYDGSSGWKISPFEGRKDPELLGEDELRGLAEEADFYGPLVNYREKGNTVEYLGHESVDGDDALRLKVTFKNGDVFNYYFDPDTYMIIRLERMQFIRGAVRESLTDYGSYKKVAGVYFPFSIEQGSKQNPGFRAKTVVESMDANVPVPVSDFRMPAQPAVPSPQTMPSRPSLANPSRLNSP